MNQKKRNRDILVPGASALGTIGVIRSLGRAGYRVHAADNDPQALGLMSRFSAASAIYPPVDSAEFCDWLADYVHRNEIELIMPGGGILSAPDEVLDRFGSLLPLPREPSITRLCQSKVLIEQLFRTPESIACGAAEHMPKALIVKRNSSLPTAVDIESLGLPVHIKADAVLALNRNAGDLVRCCQSADDALLLIEQLLSKYEAIQIQGFVDGLGAAASFVIWNGEIKSRFVNLCLHESPHTGGLCTLRQPWKNSAMLGDAERKLMRLNWQGIAMFEYRWNPETDDFHFIELNARFWAALHTALFAGTDMPRILADAFFGFETETTNPLTKSVLIRSTFPGEVAHTSSYLKDSNLSLSAKVARIFKYFFLFLKPNVVDDLNFPGDRKLYWRQLYRFLRGTFNK